MAVFREWTVLPHGPIEKLTPNLWRVSGQFGSIQRQLALARRRDGTLVVFNPIALREPEMAELEAWGRPALLVVPNGYHRQDALIWKQRYPDAAVVAPPRGRRRVAKIVPVDLFGHGDPVTDDPRGALRQVARQLTG